MTHCLLHPGETIFVPDMWWHATCNLDPYTIGIGGQLWRRGMENTFEAEGERTRPVDLDAEMFHPDTLVKDSPLPDVLEAIIFDPFAEEGTEQVEVDALGGVGVGHGPAEVHAWQGKDAKYGSAQPDLMGAPRASTAAEVESYFQSVEAYKRDGCDLWRVDISRVTRGLLEEAPSPFIIDGITSNWTALEGWRRESILADFGSAPFHLHHTHNRTLDTLLGVYGQYHMGHAVYPRHACYSDPWRPYSPFLFDQLAPSYHLPPFFKPMSTFQMGIGSGFGVGVPPENHPSSWFAAVVGAKRWLLHPDTEREPPEMMSRRKGRSVELCEPRRGMKSATTLDCIQRAGDVIWVPNYWWHETCGLDEFSAGIGGITYKGCCADLDRSVPIGTKCTAPGQGPGQNYGLADIPHCREHPEKCGSGN